MLRISCAPVGTGRQGNGAGEGKTTSSHNHKRAVLAGVPAALLVLACGAPSVARATRTLAINDTGNLRLSHYAGNVLDEQGTTTGTLPGRVKVRLNVGGNTIRASFMIEARGGSISGEGSAALHSSGRYSSFGGTLKVTRGTGSYSHARGTGKLYGAIERRSDNLTVQTIGTLAY